MTVTHRFEHYMRLKGHYPRFRKGGVIAEVRPSYITLYRDNWFQGKRLYIPRSALIPLLKWLVPLVKQMEGDFDPEKAMSAYLAQEELFERQILKRKGGRRRRLRGV